MRKQINISQTNIIQFCKALAQKRKEAPYILKLSINRKPKVDPYYNGKYENMHNYLFTLSQQKTLPTNETKINFCTRKNGKKDKY